MSSNSAWHMIKRYHSDCFLFDFVRNLYVTPILVSCSSQIVIVLPIFFVQSHKLRTRRFLHQEACPEACSVEIQYNLNRDRRRSVQKEFFFVAQSFERHSHIKPQKPKQKRLHYKPNQPHIQTKLTTMKFITLFITLVAIFAMAANAQDTDYALRGRVLKSTKAPKSLKSTKAPKSTKSPKRD